MSTWSNIETRLLDACRSYDVARVAGFDESTWNSTDLTIGHVFSGKGNYIRERNRGRLPFIEIFRQGDEQYINESRTTGRQNGRIITNFVIRIHVAGLTTQQAETNLHEIALEILKVIRSNSEDTYMDLGEEKLSEVYNSPIGYYLDINGTVEHSFDRLNYETEND